jgi:hypothetical protein
VTVRARAFWMSWRRLIRVWWIFWWRVTLFKFIMDSGSGKGGGSFEVDKGVDAA